MEDADNPLMPKEEAGSSTIPDDEYKSSGQMALTVQILAGLFFLTSIFIIVGGNIGGGIIGLLGSIEGFLAMRYLHKILIIVYLAYIFIELIVIIVFTAIFPFPTLIASLIIGLILLGASTVLCAILLWRTYKWGDAGVNDYLERKGVKKV